MRRLLAVGLLSPLILLGCDKKTDAGPSKAAPSASWVTAASASAVTSTAASASAAPSAPAPVLESTFAGYKADANNRHFLAGVERMGDDVILVLASDDGSETTTYEGKMKDPSHFALDERAGKGRKSAHVEGGYADGGALDLTLVDPKAKAPLKLHAIANGPLGGAGDDAFEESYLGSLGNKLRVRVKWKRDKHLLTGVYRYTHSKEDLKLDGTVVASTGAFQLTEKTSKGVVTGRFSGAFLTRSVVFGRWYSPDRTRSFPLVMSQDGTYPQNVSLLAPGGTLAPQEDYSELGKSCRASRMIPAFSGFATAPMLNGLVKAQSAWKPLTKDDCDGATDELPYEYESSYAVTGQKPGYVGLSFSSYEFTGGAHGMYGSQCFVADIAAGKLVSLASLLSDDGRNKLSALVTADFKKQFSVKDLTDAGFFDATAKVAPDTSLCLAVDAKGITTLDVEFQPYETAPWAMGAPSASISAADAKALFPAGSVGEAVLK